MTVCFAIGTAEPASADLYRWTDANGQEHFTMDLNQVPPEYRGQARGRAALDKARVDDQPSNLNTISTPDNVRVRRALRPRYSRAPAAVAGDVPCSSTYKAQAQQLQNEVTRWEKRIELDEQLQRRLVRTDHRLNAENRAERDQVYLERAQQALEDFEDRMRQKGVQPGCYR